MEIEQTGNQTTNIQTSKTLPPMGLVDSHHSVFDYSSGIISPLPGIFRACSDRGIANVRERLSRSWQSSLKPGNGMKAQVPIPGL